MKPLGPNPKLDELMVLVAVSAARESGNGYDLEILKREAKRATEMWEDQQRSEVKDADVEAVAREALRKAREAIASLPEDALGFGSCVVDFHDGREEPYPLRDELLSEIDAALAARAPSISLATDAMADAHKQWWSSVCRKGDPQRRPHLVSEAFEAGWSAALAQAPRPMGEGKGE